MAQAGGVGRSKLAGVEVRDDAFSVANVCIGDRFNPDHPNISRVHTNVNLDMGPEHWSFRDWDPTFGDINRYQLVEWLGDGRYSDVFMGLRDDGQHVAIKLLKPVNADRVRRELKILTVVQGHPCILQLLDVVIDPREGIPAMVTVAVSGNRPWRQLFGEMSLDDSRFYIYRVLQALAHTHARGVMHRDVKPLNVLCGSPRGPVVLADWGLAEFYHPYRIYSVHVATRYYKSPEILLGYEYYDYSLDVWSTGVMLLEILSEKHHVFDGADNEHQIDAVAAVIDPLEIFAWADRYKVPIDSAVRERLRTRRASGIEALVSTRKRGRDKDAVDLLQRMLCVDHKRRITAEEALAHPFFRMVRDEDARLAAQ